MLATKINKGSKHTQDSKLANENKLPTVENTSVDENIGQDNKSQDVRDKIILTFIKAKLFFSRMDGRPRWW